MQYFQLSIVIINRGRPQNGFNLQLKNNDDKENIFDDEHAALAWDVQFLQQRR